MTNRPPNCKAYERGDQWFCDRCGLVWDLNDDDPPSCQIDPVILKQIQIANNSTYGAPGRDKDFAHDQVEKMRDILKPEYCRHGVPVTSKCRNCDISRYKKRMENE